MGTKEQKPKKRTNGGEADDEEEGGEGRRGNANEWQEPMRTENPHGLDKIV